MKGVGKTKLAIAMLFIMILSIIPVLTLPAEAVKVTTPTLLEYVPPNGEAVHRSLCSNPEWLKVHTISEIHHDTWIHVLGKDCYGQNIEAKTLIPSGTPLQSNFILVDWYSKEPVTFSKITDVYQEGGEHCNSFEIHTLPEPREDYLGLYHLSNGYVPHYEGPYPVEPSNPDPLKVAINWVDVNGNGVPADADGNPEPGEFTNLPTQDSTIHIIGLDQCGELLEKDVFIPKNSKIVNVVISDKTWSTVCTVTGGLQAISYYIFTHPEPQRPILTYHIMINSIKVTVRDHNILADGQSTAEVTITLLDIDGHEVHWAVDIPGFQSAPPIEINVASSGGKVQPSCDIEIPGCNTCAVTWLTSDTNARLVKVSAVAFLPPVQRYENDQWRQICPPTTLTDCVEMCFDGVNSNPTCIPDYPYRTKVCRIEDGRANKEDTCEQTYAVFINLVRGCNLISIPFVPDEELCWGDLPGAEQYLCKVCTYCAFEKKWYCYEFGDDPVDGIPIKDGWAYWVKAKENCTLVLSGEFMEAAETPPSYQMAIGWNMVGVTSLIPRTTYSYLGSLNIEEALKLWGPVWAFREDHWERNPTMVYPGEGLWVFSYDGILAP